MPAMRPAAPLRRLVLGPAVLTAAVACQSSSTPAGPPAFTATTSAAAVTPPAGPVTTTAPAATALPMSTEKVLRFMTPNLVGRDLQSAQDAVQTFGVFFCKSHDLAGNRMQILDSNW